VKLRLGHLYPDYLNIYADRGNIAVLDQRARWRGHELEVAALSVGARIDPQAHDLLYVGGGQDREQALVARELAAKADDVLAAAADGCAVLAVCGGYQLLGHSYQLGENRIEGLGLADLETVREEGPRLIGNVAIELDLGDGRRTVAGFENHGGRTHLGPGAQPLGRVVKGHGNNSRDGFEGVRRRNMLGTYLHGPLLPKNAWLADRLIALAVARREGAEPRLEPLDDELEAAAHESAERAAMRG
jgi:lipid II isoglutaminyl synthase (glutamine-hydrolysing)